MTIAKAYRLIPMDACLIVPPKNEIQQAYEIIEDMIKVCEDNNSRFRLYAFAQSFKGKSSIEKYVGVKRLHEFVYQNMPYSADLVHTQLIKTPVCAFWHRLMGNDCKSLTAFVYAVLYNLGLDRALNFVSFPPLQMPNTQTWIDQLHVFPSVYIDGVEYYIDGTLPAFNQLTNSPIVEWLVKKENEILKHRA